jgi:pimeloyl-ACP methyl ester carboxylesterase
MLPQWTQNELIVNGARLHYYRTGNGAKPPLVLAHGFSDDGLCWQPTAADLETEYDVIMPDARGHGLSERVRPGEQVDMASDLAMIIRKLGLEHPIVGGHSMGANVAFQLGVRFPDLTRALVLEDPPWWLSEQAEMRPIDRHEEHPMAGWVRTIMTHTAEELMDQCRAEHPTWPEVVVQTWCAAKKRLDPDIISILRIDGNNWQEKVGAIACPVLVFTAEVDQGGIITPAVAAKVCELNSYITIAHIAGVGHHIRFGNYAAYMQALRSFLAGIRPYR